MPNQSNPEVAKVVSTDLSGRTVTVQSYANPKEQVWQTLSSGSTANLGDRLQAQFDFSAQQGKYIKEVYLMYQMANKSTTAGDSYRHVGGIIPFIDSIILNINEKQIYLYQFGHAEYGFWENYSNFGGNPLRQFYKKYRSTLQGWEIDGNNSFDASAAMPSDLNTIATNIAGNVTTSGVYYLPLSAITNLFNMTPTSYLWRFNLQIQLKAPVGGSMEELRTAGIPTTVTKSLIDMVQFKNLKYQVIFDSYNKSVTPQGVPLTIHDNYYETKTYGISAVGSTGTVSNMTEIRLDQDFSPLQNIKKIYLHVRPDALNNANPDSNKLTGFAFHNSWSITRVQILRNGIQILDLEDRTALGLQIDNYYSEKFRHRDFAPYASSIENDQILTGFFIDMSRATLPQNNDDKQVVKAINGITNNLNKFGAYTLRVYLNYDSAKFHTLSCTVQATRLFHLSDRSSNYRVSEEI